MSDPPRPPKTIAKQNKTQKLKEETKLKVETDQTKSK